MMSKDKSPALTDLGNGLAIEAIDTLPKGCLTVSPNLSLANPESIHNFARFANVLEDAYKKGVNATSKPNSDGAAAYIIRNAIPALKSYYPSLCKEAEAYLNGTFEVVAEGVIPQKMIYEQMLQVNKVLEQKNIALEAKIAELEAMSQHPGRMTTTDISDRISRYILDNPRTKSEVKGLLRSAASEADRFYNGMCAWKASAQEKDKTIAKLNKRLGNNGM